MYTHKYMYIDGARYITAPSDTRYTSYRIRSLTAVSSVCMSKHVGCCLSTHKHQDVTDRDCSIHTPSRLDADRLLYDSSHYIAIRLNCLKLHII